MEGSFNKSLLYYLSRLQLSDLQLMEQQRTILLHVFNREDVLAWLPTGFGKSLCYKALSFVFDHKLKRCSHNGGGSVLIVVSMLLSLMTEQVEKLRQRGIPCAILASVDNRSVSSASHEAGCLNQWMLQATVHCTRGHNWGTKVEGYACE